jgi:hypothetical protein
MGPNGTPVNGDKLHQRVCPPYPPGGSGPDEDPIVDH